MPGLPILPTFELLCHPPRHGIHYCIGASLAKTEIRLVLEELTRHYPSLRLAPDKPVLPMPSFILRAYQEMVLEID